MLVFISWSGPTSKLIAEELSTWTRRVIQRVETWISTSDIEKGSRWANEIAKKLEEATVGIICLAPDNLDSPWLLFEAGALSKSIEQSYVCTYLYKLEPTDVRQPLAQFQATKANKNDTKKMLQTINRALGDEKISDSDLDETFEVWWPRLDKELRTIPAKVGLAEKQVIRPEKEMLEEVLEIVRVMGKDIQSFTSRPVFVSSASEEFLRDYPWLAASYEQWRYNRKWDNVPPEVYSGSSKTDQDDLITKLHMMQRDLEERGKEEKGKDSIE
jgi:hypothetical protein